MQLFKRFRHMDQSIAHKAERALKKYRLRGNERVGGQFAVPLGNNKALVIERTVYGWEFYRVVNVTFRHKALLTPQQAKLAAQRGIDHQHFCVTPFMGEQK
ncbi:hypothetical protein GCM10011332_29560 [Terasakiella brassicae]|uniref:Uncharacterized protein n=1 Tax=Terasakiella brassicae TaxID=1634917 RepID=A0A917C608_9PROT|nr:hypothetical protein [Terasakiella brassicae]GGF73594.1 hypothetical protein GCM10011332_29560 [Terasakiella brassicae]